MSLPDCPYRTPCSCGCGGNCTASFIPMESLPVVCERILLVELCPEGWR